MKNLINPFSVQRHLDLWSVAAFDTNGGGGGGGGSDDRPTKVDIGPPTKENKDKALEIAAELNVKNPGYNYTRGYDANTGEVRVINVPKDSGGSKSSSTTAMTVPEEVVVPEVVVPEEEVTPTPSTPAPSSDGGGPSYSSSPSSSPVVTPSNVTPDPIPEFVDDAVIVQTQKPTYTGGSTTSTDVVERPELGTVSSPLQTANLSAVPETVTYRDNYTGTTMRNLTSPSQGQQGIQNVLYANPTGQTVYVTEINGQPVTYVPPGYVRADSAAPMGTAPAQAPQAEVSQEDNEALTSAIGASISSLFNEGGTVKGASLDDLALEGMYRMASKFLGYDGPKTREALAKFQQSSPMAAAKMKSYNNAMVTAANKGGLMRKGFQEGGYTNKELAGLQKGVVQQTMQPRQATVAQIAPQAADFVAPTAGQTVPQAPYAEAAKVGTVEQAMLPVATPAATMQPATAADAVQQMTAATQAVQGQVSTEAQAQAAQQLTTSVSGMEAAQGTATMVNSPAAREIQAGELVSGVADAEKAATFNEQIQAATATPSKQATVQGQLEGLMQQFEGGETPAWAAGSMRTAMATLSARGLGASSMAGQAVIQATMEAALPIAQMDAQTQASFEAQNLSNRQQRAMLAAQQRAQFLGQEFDQAFQSRVANSARIGDIANMNFTAEQQVALENSRAANTMELSNLNNRQAMVMSEAAALSQLDTQNLNNRQQTAVQNAQNFMQMDMTNVSNEQQTAMFKAQQNIQALFTDQAAENAAQQFNASSENQTNQFFSNLSNQTSQFNAAQRNAMDQFNVNSVNALREFNSEIQQQRDLFNAQNGLVVAQANAQWRQNLATVNTAAQNESNAEFARTMNGLTERNMDAIWQQQRDIMSYTFQQDNNNADRATSIALQTMQNEASATTAAASKSSAFASAAGSLISAIF